MSTIGIIQGFLYMLFGAFFLWMGAFQLITSMLPYDVAMKVSEIHGAWCREHLFKLPPAKERK